MRRLLLLLSLILTLSNECDAQGTGTSQAQEDEKQLIGVLSYMKQAMLFNKDLPQEKVYLHFDNTGYFKGETIWFKAYVVRADNCLPTNKSQVVYVELVNPTGDVIETKKLHVQDGTAYGELKLDSIFGSGFYEVRAYTRYMTNWGNGGIFSRVFPVFEAPKKEGDYSKMYIDYAGHKRRLPNVRSNEEAGDNTREDRRLSVRFYPEGGYMVRGLRSRVAFSVTDKNGTTQSIGGSLLDENKEILFPVATRQDGRGVFEITPDGKPKYLRLSEKNGKQHDFLLPLAKNEGIVMNLDMMKDDEISATLYATPSMEGRLMGYTLMHNGIVIHADTMKCASALMIPFDRKSMPAGVSQLTFFTSDGHIQAERQFFICPVSNVEDTIRVTSPTAYPKPCGKIVLNIKAQPNSNISLSAMDAATMTNGKEGNALTWMLLSSDIKGYIHDPDYYFEADDAEHRMAADLLMMVQGWRRYDWALMANAMDENKGYSLFTKETAKFNQPVEDKLYLFGQLKSKSRSNPVDNTWLETALYNKAGQSLKGTAKTDSLGNYAFELPAISGEWNMVINTGKADKNGYWKDVNFFVGIDRHFSPKKRVITQNEAITIDLLAPNLFNDQKSRQAAKDDNVYVPIQKREHVLPTIVVKAKRRIFDGARAAWESENNAQMYAAMYYNADVDADRFADEGMQVPSLYSWLIVRNPFFSGSTKDGDFTESSAAEAADVSVAESRTASLGDIADGDMVNENDAIQMSEMSSTTSKGLNGENLDEGLFESSDRQHRIYQDGLGYKNRPIIGILNNTYAQITHLGTVGKFSSFEVLQRCVEDMPIFIDEVKSVYISESSSAYKSYLYCPDLTGKDPVTVFVYTHYNMKQNKKGVRTTHFQGYNEPSTFEMEDYSVLPPMEDFRRTIFWAPEIKTDANGNAKVEFWNNSSCHEMHISAEGITGNGRFLVNE